MKVCKKCGAQMDDDKFFCTYCGSKLSNNVNRKNGNSKWLIIIPIVVVVLFLMLAVVGGGCWFFWKYYNNRTSDYDEYDMDTITEMVDSVAISEDDSDNPYEEVVEEDDEYEPEEDDDEIEATIGALFEKKEAKKEVRSDLEDNHEDYVDRKTPSPSNKVYDVVEEMPQFPGGASALFDYLARNIQYPVVAEENGIQGRVVVSFVVDRDGSITDVRVQKGVDPSLDKEALRVVRSMPRWIPGKQDGAPVRVKYTVPVTFKLQ